MTREEYMIEALRTSSPIHERFMTENAWRLTHAALGLITEVAEMKQASDRTNFLEELGDCLWFHNLAVSVFPDLITRLNENASGATKVANPLFQLETLVTSFADMVKGHLFYGKSNEQELRNTLLLLDGLFDRLADLDAGIPLAELRTANIRKLQARYGASAGFSEAKALNRDLEAERRVLEGGSQP